MNDGQVLDYLSSFKAGAASVITGFEKLAVLAYNLLLGWTKGDYIDTLLNTGNEVDAFNNEYFAWATDSYVVDLDGFKIDDFHDWMNTLSYTGGMIVAGWATGGGMKWVAGKGAHLAQTGTNAFTKGAGHLLQFTGNLYARSTGLYKGYTSAKGMEQTAARLSGWAPTWNHFKTVSTYAFKDFMGNMQQLTNERIQQKLRDPSSQVATDGQIIGMAAANTGMNFAISMVFAGGIDDNQTARWASVLRSKEAIRTGAPTPFTSWLLKYSMPINITSEFIDNFLTMYSSSIMGFDPETNSVKWTKNARDEEGNMMWNNMIRTAAQAALTTLPTAFSQMQRRNVWGEHIQEVGNNTLKALQDAETNAKTPEQAKTARYVRIQFLEDIKNPHIKNQDGSEITDPTVNERYFYALQNLHENIKGEDNLSMVTRIFEDVCNPKMLSIYKEMSQLCEERYEKYQKKMIEFDNKLATKGLKQTLRGNLLEYFKNIAAPYEATKKFYEQNPGEGPEHSSEVYANSIYVNYLRALDLDEAQNKEDKLRSLYKANIEQTAEALEDVTEKHLSYQSLVKNQDKEFKQAVNDAAVKQAEALGITKDDVLANSRFYRIKNETTDRASYNTQRAAFTLAQKFMPQAFFKVDDNTFGLVGINGELGKLFSIDLTNKMSLAMHAMSMHDQPAKEVAMELIVSTVLGSERVKTLDDAKQKAEAKEIVSTIIDTAVTNKIMSKLEAAEFICTLADADTPISQEIAKMFDVAVNVKNVNKIDSLSEMEQYALIYASLRHLNGEGSKRFSNKTIAAEALLQKNYTDLVEEVFTDMDRRGMLPDLVRGSFYETKRDHELFQLAIDKLVTYAIDATKVIGEGGLNEKLSREVAVKELLKIQHPDLSDELLQAKVDEVMKYINILTTFKSIEYEGDKVVIDMSKFSTKTVRDAVKEVQRVDKYALPARDEANTLGRIKEHDAKVYAETHTQYGGDKIVVKLDDSNMDQIHALYDLLVKADFIDSSYHKKPETAADMKKILGFGLSKEGEAFARFKNHTEFDTKIIDDKMADLIAKRMRTIDLKEFGHRCTVIDPTHRNAVQYDYYKLLASNININKISTSAFTRMRRLKGKEMIYINPIDYDSFSVEENGVPMFIKVPEERNTKGGRAGNKRDETYATINTKAQAANVNKDLAMTLMVSEYIDFITKNRNMNIVIENNPSEIAKLYELGIIGENGFYHLEDTPTFKDGSIEPTYVRLKLNDGVTRQDMELYLVSNKSPNLFKILPFVSSKKANFDIPFLTPEGRKLEFVPDITGGLTTDYRGLYEIGNITFDYDQTKQLRNNLLVELFSRAQDGSYVYSPFSEDHIVFDIDALMKKYNTKNPNEAYAKYREDGDLLKGFNDPFYNLVMAYEEIGTKYRAADGEANDDHKIWLTNPDVLKKMVKAAQTPDFEVTDAFIKDIVNTYKSSYDVDAELDYNAPYNYHDITFGSYYGSRTNVEGDTYMSKGLYDATLGIVYAPIDVAFEDTDVVKNEIKAAYNYVKDNVDFLGTTRYSSELINPDSESFIIHEPDGATALWALMTASDNRITIQDIDAYYRIDAEDWNNFFEALGLKEEGKKIRQQLETTYETLIKYLYGDDKLKPRISNKLTMNARTVSARESWGGKGFGINARGKNQKRVLLDRGANYLTLESDTPPLTEERLLDGLTGKLGGFSFRELNPTRAELAKMTDQDKQDIVNNVMMQNLAKIKVEDNLDTQGNSLIQDLSSEVNLSKLLNSKLHTYDSIEKELNFSESNDEVKTNLMKTAAVLVDRASGSRYTPNWAKYSFIDNETGKEFMMANAVKTDGRRSVIDLFETVWNTNNSDLVGKTFIELEDHDVDSPNGLSYRYKTFKAESDVINFKNELMLQLLKDNEWRMDDLKGKDIYTKLTNMSNKESTQLLNKIMSDSISVKDKANNLKINLSNTNISELWKLMLTPSVYNSINKNFVQDLMNIGESAIYSDSAEVRRIASAIIEGIDYSLLSPEDRTRVDDMRQALAKSLGSKDMAFLSDFDSSIESLQEKIHRGKKLTAKELEKYRTAYNMFSSLYTTDEKGRKIIDPNSKIINGVKLYMYNNFDRAEVLGYVTSKSRSLESRYLNKIHGYEDFYNIKDGSGVVQQVSSNDLLNFYTEGSTSNIKTIYHMDAETSNIVKGDTGRVANDIKDVFQVSVIIDKNVDGKVISEQVTYFVKHDITPEEWVDLYINKDDDFYKRNPEFQKIVDEYSKISNDNPNLKTEAEIEALLRGDMYGAPDMYVAYNGNFMEFEIFKNFFNKDAKLLDLMYSVFKLETDTTKSISQDSMYKRTFSEDYTGEKHTADQDTRDMRELAIELFKKSLNMAEDRNKLINDIDRLFPEGMSDNDKLEVFRAVDDYFSKLYEQDRNHFKDYVPTLDSIHNIQRAINYLENYARGGLYFELAEQLDYDKGYGKIIRDKNLQDNIIDIITVKALETNGDVRRALLNIQKAYYTIEDLEKPGMGDLITDKMANKDESLLRALGYSEDLLLSPEAQDLRKTIVTEYSKGINAFLNGSVYDIASSEAKRYDKERDLVPYLLATQNVIKDSVDMLDVNSYNSLKELFKQPISLIEGMMPGSLKNYYDTSIKYDDSGVRDLAAQIKNVLNDNRGTGSFLGLYSMMNAAKRYGNDFNEIDPATGKVIGKLSTVNPGDMVITRRALKELFNVFDIEQMRGTDGNLYLLSITYPADNMNPILPLRVKVIEGDGLNVYFTPETQEILRNRDFDGDHTMTTVLAPDRYTEIDESGETKVFNDSFLKIAPILYKSMWSSQAVYSDIAYALEMDFAGGSAPGMEMALLGSRPEIVKLCLEIDKILEANDGTIRLSVEDKNKIDNIVAQIADTAKSLSKEEKNEIRFKLNMTESEYDAFCDKFAEKMSFVEFYSNTQRPMRFVNNPSLYNKTVDGVDTYTFRSRKAVFSLNALTKSNILDPEIGTYQKALSAMGMINKDLNQPFKELYTPSVYLTGSVSDAIDSKINNYNDFSKFMYELNTSLKQQINSLMNQKVVSETARDHYYDYLMKLSDYATKDVDTNDTGLLRQKAKETLMQAVWDLDLFLKNDKNLNTELLNALDDVANDTSFRKYLERTETLSRKLDELNHEHLRIKGSGISDTPIANALMSNIINSRLHPEAEGSINHLGILNTDIDETTTVNEFVRNQGYNNKVNIFLTKGALGTSEDLIGINTGFKGTADEMQVHASKTRYASYDVIDTTKNNYDMNVLKYGEYIPAGTVIGKDSKGNNITADKSFIVGGHFKKKNAIITMHIENLDGKKVTGSGIFKGVTQGVTLRNIELKDIEGKQPTASSVDFIASSQNAFKNFNKLAQGADYAEMLRNAIPVKYVDGDGRTLEGYLLKGVPFNVIGNDLIYQVKMDPNRPADYRTFELMATPGAATVLQLARFGDVVVKRDDNGKLYLDFSELTEAIQGNKKNHDVIWKDVGTNIMVLRSAYLANAIKEKDFLEFVNGFNNRNEFTSKEDYLDNLRTSPEKVNSSRSLNEQYRMIQKLGKDKFLKLVNTNDMTRYIFSQEVEDLLNPTIPSTFSDEFFKNPISPRSNNSGKYEMATVKVSDEDTGAYVVGGEKINASDRDVNDALLIQNGLLHLPFNQFYRGLTGNFIDEKAIIKGTMDGNLGYGVHLRDSASIGNNWTAVDYNMGSRLEGLGINKNFAAVGLKTIIPGPQDTDVIARLDDDLFTRGSGLRDVTNAYEDPSTNTYNSALANLEKTGRVSTGFPADVRMSYFLSLMMDPYMTKLEKLGKLKNVDSVDYNKLTNQFLSTDKGLRYTRVHDNGRVSLKDALREINSGTKGFMLRQDLKDNLDKPQLSFEDVRKFKQSGVIEKIKENESHINDLARQRTESFKKLVTAVRTSGSDIHKSDIKFTWNVTNETAEYRSNWMTRSGISTDNADQLSVDVGIKNYLAEAEYMQMDFNNRLTNLEKLVLKTNMTEFEQFVKYNWLKAATSVDKEGAGTRFKFLDVDPIEFESGTLKARHDAYARNNPEVVKLFEDHFKSMVYLAEKTSAMLNEPFESYYLFMMPFVPKDIETRSATVKQNLKSLSSMTKAYDPTFKQNLVKQNLVFDFFGGSRKMINELTRLYSARNISDSLLGVRTGKAIIDNKDIVNKTYEIINDTDTFEDLKVYNKFDSEVTQTVLDVISMYTDIDLYRLRRSAKNGAELLKRAYIEVNDRANDLRDRLELEVGARLSLSDVYNLANVNEHVNLTTKQLAKETYNNMWAQVIVAQRMIERSSRASNKLVNYLASLETSGYVLTNKLGQKIIKGGEIAPISAASMAYLKDNAELTFNSQSDTMFAQFVLEKALSGEIYLCPKSLADQLESKVFTSKVPGRVMSVLKKAASTSAGLQMAIPTKMASRFLRYTGSDLAIGGIANTDVLAFVPQASKELSQAAMTGGKVLTPELEGYLMREGQPSLWGGTNKDPVTYTEDLSEGILGKYTEFMTRPLDLQNHIGRYAIYLAAKKSFDNGRPWYGSQYYNKAAIDALGSNEDKAMYIMDYMLGSPGGFPYVTRKTSGLMMFATFPMNLTRTLGSYGMSVGRLFQEGITKDNATQWYNTVFMPAIGVAGLSMLSNALIAAVCDAYGIDEETEEEWKEEGVTLDPIGSLFGGTPSVVYDSINPAYQLKEMFINPFTNEYNETLPEKAYGFIKANMLSKLNPLIKVPIEVLTGRELYGDSAEGYQQADPLLSTEKKYQYTNLENGMKKVLGFFVGTNIANNVIDQQKYAKYNDEDSSFISALFKGLSKGINDDLGNQKSWKKDTSNYYAFITDIRSFTNKDNKNRSYYLDIEDLSDSEKLYYNRTYGTQYGEYNEEDYMRVNGTLKRMIHARESQTTIYNYIVKEYNDNNVSEATLRAALNNNSIVRKINSLKENKAAYIATLSQSEITRLQEAILYEEEMYPMLQKLFPTQQYRKSTYLSNYSAPYVPKTYSSGKKYFNYYPGKYYPQTFSYNKKNGYYTNPNYNIVRVNVSPQMGIWDNDYNLTSHDTGVAYKDRSDLEWLRS